MQIRNARAFPVATTFGSRSPRELFATVVIKATFALPESEGAASVALEQLPVLTQDVPYDAEKPDGLLKFESDLAPFKPRADVVVVGSAYPGRGKSAAALDVSIRVGRLEQVIRVIGDRQWCFTSDYAQPAIVGPVEFEAMPLTYDRAFGGADEAELVSSPMNPFGRGLIAQKTVPSAHRRPLPNLENPADMVRSWESRPLPVGCGFYPRSALPRRKYLGTHDAAWKATRCPHPPEDFRFDFYNGAHPNLQVEGYLQGDEDVLLTHVRPGGRPLRFRLPGVRPLVQVRYAAPEGSRPQEQAVSAPLDTLVFVPDQGLFCQVWRAVVPYRASDASDLQVITIDYERVAGKRWVS